MSQLVVAPVRVDAAEHPVADRVGDLVVEAVTGQRRVVRLQVELVLALEAVPDEEAVHRGRVAVVLVLRRLVRLRLDEQQPLEADLVLVLRDERQEPGELAVLVGEVRVEQRVVALAAAPQDVVLAAEPVRRLEHQLDLGGGEGEDLRVRVRRGAGHVARVPEQVRRAPQEADAGLGHARLDHVHDRVEDPAGLPAVMPLRRDVAIVDAEIGDPELRQELERGVDLHLGRDERVEPRREPRSVERADAEDVRARPRERVPKARADPEVVLHALAEHRPVGLVDAERQRVRRVRAAERDPPRNAREEGLAHAVLRRMGRARRGAR